MTRHRAIPPSDRPEVIVVPHGFQTHYETGFVTGLVTNGVRVLLVGSDSTDGKHMPPTVDVINLRGSQSPGRSRLRKAANLIRYHARLVELVARNRSSTVHVVGLLSPLLLIGVIENAMLRLLSRKLLVTVHDVLPHDQHTRLNWWLAWIAFRIPHVLVVHTENVKRRLTSEFNVPEQRIVVVQHGLNVHFSGHEVSRDEARKLLRLTDNEFAVLFFGVWAPYKGLDILIRAFANVGPEWRLFIVGLPRNAAYRAEIQSLVEKSPRRESVVIVDRFVDDVEIPQYFSAADLCAMPYRHIDQSGVLFTALLFGTPLLVTDVGEFSKYVTQDIGLVVREASDQAVTNGLQEFRSTVARYDRGVIRDKARQYAWQSTVLPLLDIYRFRHGRPAI